MFWVLTAIRLLTNGVKSRQEQELLPWAILGVYLDDPPALIDEIYRVKAMTYHPDHGGNEEKMKTLNWAYTEIKRIRGMQ